jgi:hypothetical protein
VSDGLLITCSLHVSTRSLAFDTTLTIGFARTGTARGAYGVSTAWVARAARATRSPCSRPGPHSASWQFAREGHLLPAAYGAPARLHSPIKLGYKSVKYLTRITFLPERNGGYWSDQGYEWFAGM